MENFGFPNLFFQNLPVQGPFQQSYRCYSIAMMPVQKSIYTNGGGKILLPPSALDNLARLHIEYPMLFEVSNPRVPNGKKTHCGVLEFTAEEGRCYVPYWMMQMLLIEEDGFISIKSTTLPKGTFVKIQPQTSNFLDISNPKAVLENRLRNFSALTQGDVLMIEYNKNNYFLSVIEVKPLTASKAISIIETDLNLEFEEPPDYKARTASAPQNIKNANNMKKESDSEDEDDKKTFKPFSGSGYSLRDTPGKLSQSPKPMSPSSVGSPVGSSMAKIVSSSKKQESDSESEDEDDKKKFKAFSGTGYSLKR